MRARFPSRDELLLVLILLAPACSSGSAGAFSLRSPQIPFAYPALQAVLNAVDGFIAVATDQVDAQTFSVVDLCHDFTLFLRTATQNWMGTGIDSEIGAFNTSWVIGSPALYEIFPPAATNGWSATCHWEPGGDLDVTLYDAAFVTQGMVRYSGVDRHHFGFYINGPNGLWYSQDGRNPGNNAQVLTYAGTQAGYNYGEWFECFETQAYNPGSSTFTGALVMIEPVCQVVPVRTGTWGGLKAIYR